MEERAQVSFDYLIILTFALSLTVVASVLIQVVNTIAASAIQRIMNYRDSALSSLV
jgi:hypothetical protein